MSASTTPDPASDPAPDRASYPAPDGSTVVCVPGLGLGAAEWRDATDLLRGHPAVREADVRVLPVFGLRPSSGVDLRPSALAAQLAAGLTGPTVLVGHSASCQVVAHAAALAPGRVSILVLVGPTTDPRAATWPRLAARWLRTAAWERPSQVPLLARSYTRTGLGWMRRGMEAARHEDLRVDLRAVGCPVLVVRGRRDRICPEDWARELVATAPPGSAVLTLARGAHMVPLTHADLVAAAVADFVVRRGGPPIPS